MLASKSIRQQYRGYTITVAQVLGSWRCSIALLRAMSSDGSLLF